MLWRTVDIQHFKHKPMLWSWTDSTIRTLLYKSNNHNINRITPPLSMTICNPSLKHPWIADRSIMFRMLYRPILVLESTWWTFTTHHNIFSNNAESVHKNSNYVNHHATIYNNLFNFPNLAIIGNIITNIQTILNLYMHGSCIEQWDFSCG